MGVHTLREISRRNYDCARGTKPQGCNHNFWGIFLVARTCLRINEFVTRGNRKMNAERDADGLFSNALPLTRSNSALSRSLFSTYEMGKPWNKHCLTVHFIRLVSKSLQQCSVQEPRCHFAHVRTFCERNRPCYEHHTLALSPGLFILLGSGEKVLDRLQRACAYFTY